MTAAREVPPVIAGRAVLAGSCPALAGSGSREPADVALPAALAAELLREPDRGWAQWAAAACVLHRRLGAIGPVALASPPLRSRGAELSLHLIRAAPVVAFGELVRAIRTDDWPAARSGLEVARWSVADPSGMCELLIGEVAQHRGRAVSGLAALTVDLDRCLVRIDPGSGPWDTAGLTVLVGWLVRLVEAGMAVPGSPIGEVALLGAAERHRILADWDPRPSATPAGIDVSVAEAIARTPDAVAVMAPEGPLTYAELGVAAARLAADLSAAGLRRGDLVGVWGPLSARTLVAAVATWWAGGVLVLLDPSAPAARIADSAAGLALLLATAPDPPDVGVAVLAVPAEASPAEAGSVGPFRPAAPEDLAYVLYTSGSTGTAKGVEATHGGLANYLAWAARAYGLSPGTRVPVASALSYDLTVTALFAPLVAGATVVIPAASDPVSLMGCVGADQPAAMVKLTPAHLAALADELAVVAPGIERLVLGGEALLPGHLGTVARLAPDVTVVNEYGPTEATVAVTAHRVSAARAAAGAGPVPIGRAIDNAEVYLLDPDLQPVPDGVVGEVFLAGAGIARGYRRLPRQTAGSFVPHPFGAPGQRSYRTGDLAFRDGNGDLVFVGRRDRQVKLGGVRVELAEIESALLAVPGVTGAAVTTSRRPDGIVTATAHLVCQGRPPTLSAVRRQLAGRVPRAAIPGRVMVVEELPRAASGKLDLVALDPALVPAVGTPGPATPGLGGPPRGPVESALAAIWQDLLGGDPGREDDFFALGGDSILAIRIVARAREEGLVISPSQVFEFGTIAGLAAVAQPVADPASEDPGPVPLTPTQFWYLTGAAAAADGYCQYREYRMAAPIGPAEVLDALRWLVARHDALRLSVRVRDGRWEQVLAAHAEPAVTHVALSGSPSDEPAWRRSCSQALAASRAEGPMVSCALGVSEGHVTRVLLAIHHLAVDHLSWLFLTADLDRALRGEFAAGPAPSFAGWARAQVAVPVEAAREAVPGPSAASDQLTTAELDPQTWAQLVRDARDSYNADPLDLLATALIRSGAAGDCLAVETAGRDAPGTAGAVGWFTAITPVPVPAAADRTRMPLATVKDAIRRPAGPLVGTVPTAGVTHLGEVAPQGLAAPPAGAVLIPHAQRGYLARAAGMPTPLAVTGAEVQGRLVVEVRHRGHLAEAGLAGDIVAQLRVLAAELAGSAGPGATPGDFLRVEIDDAELAAILAGIEEAR